MKEARQGINYVLGYMLPIPRKKTIFRKSPKIEEVETRWTHSLYGWKEDEMSTH